MVSEDLARGTQDDVGGRMVSHERLSSIRIDRARHPRSPKTTRVATDEMQDGRPGSLDIVDFEFVDRPVVGFLTAALRIEERLIEDDGLALDRDDFRAERAPAAVLVHTKLRRREFLLDGESLLGLGNRTLVSRRHLSVEVIRDFDRQVREFLDDVRIESVAVVELQERFDVESLAGGRELGGDFPDGRPPLLERLLVPGLLDLEQLQDVPLVEEELRIVLADLVDHEGDRVGQAVRDVQVLQRPESPPDQEAREIALPAVRRYDAVAEEEDQRSRVVADRVQRLEGRDLRNEFVDRDPDARRRLLANLADVRQGLDLEHAGDFRVLPEDAVVDALGSGRALQVRQRLTEHGFVRGCRRLREPRQSLEAISRVHDLGPHRDAVAVDLPVHHEHQGRRFGAAEDDLEAWAAVAASLPPRLLVADERRVDAEPLGQEEMADLDRPVLEVDEFLGEVERMMGHHLEHREVLAGLPDVVDVQESHARLAERQRVRGRARLAADDPRLERIHAGLDEEDVIAPARDDRVALHARVAVLLEERQEVLAHRAVGELLLEGRRADEVVLLAGRFPARFVDAERPERRVALRTRLAGEHLLPKQLDLVFTLGHFRPPNERRPLKVLGGDASTASGFGLFRICTVRLSTRW